jgi:riboflavin-specific deaminase-like protein
MRQLLPHCVDDVDLREAYRHPGDHAWVRANMVSSLDGSATQEGVSAGISGPVDKRVFGTLRGLCDVVMVGAGTARIEGYDTPKARPSYAEHRASLGQRPAPVLVLVSRRLDLDLAGPLFGGAERTIVVTSERSDPELRQQLGEVADVLVAGESEVDLPYAVRELGDRGLPRILCEGGPTLLAAMVAADCLDELCLTLSPKAVGGVGPRIMHGVTLDQDYRPGHLLEQDGILFGRYLRA